MKNFRTYIFPFVVCLCLVLNAYAADNQFEGELEFLQMQNSDESMQAMSSSMTFNGKSTGKVIVKGDKVMMQNDAYNIVIMFDPNNNRISYFFPLLNKCLVANDYKAYRDASGMLTKEGCVINAAGMTIKLKPQVFKIQEMNKTKEILGYQAKGMSAHIEVAPSVYDMEYYVIPVKMPESYKYMQLGGYDAGGLVAKVNYVMESNMSMNLSNKMKEKAKKNMQIVDADKFRFGKNKSSIAIEITKINPRKVDDSEFEISGEVQHFTSFMEMSKAMLPIIQENIQYLKEHNLLPEQISDGVVYELDEEWIN